MIRDTHGNVCEWCSNAPGEGLGDGGERVHRGGSWLDWALGCRSAHRASDDPTHSHRSLGFRVVVSGLP